MEKEDNRTGVRIPHHGENVKKFRALRGFKQEIFAEMLGKYEKWLYELEKKPIIDDETLQLIADKLQVHIDVLKNYTDDCDIQINFNGDNISGSGYLPNYTENDVQEIAAALKPLYEEINLKNIEIYKLTLQIEELKKKK